jgi:hypothetical protein
MLWLLCFSFALPNSLLQKLWVLGRKMFKWEINTLLLCGYFRDQTIQIFFFRQEAILNGMCGNHHVYKHTHISNSLPNFIFIYIKQHNVIHITIVCALACADVMMTVSWQGQWLFSNHQVYCSKTWLIRKSIDQKKFYELWRTSIIQIKEQLSIYWRN